MSVLRIVISLQNFLRSLTWECRVALSLSSRFSCLRAGTRASLHESALSIRLLGQTVAGWHF
jgi:hypothetical protein